MYSVSTQVSTGFDETIERVTEALKGEGFGVLSDIDVAATLRNKLGIEHRPYRILGACNPHYAQQAVAAEPEIGVLLPCNFVVREDESGTVHVSFMDPLTVLDLVHSKEIHGFASEVRDRLDRVLKSVAA